MLLSRLTNSEGFTLIELIAVMVILSIWGAIAVKKVVAVTGTSEQQVLVQGMVEMNTRESLTWYYQKISAAGYQGDGPLWSQIDTNLGDDYTWTTGPDADGGELGFASQTVTLTRTHSKIDAPGKWSP